MDISYWQLDHLSTFMNLIEEKYPELIALFEQAGLKELCRLRNSGFDVESLQEANIDGLNEYIKQGLQLRHSV